MNIGGGNTTRLHQGAETTFPATITIAPLPHQAVVKDLVPDLDEFLRAARLRCSPT